MYPVSQSFHNLMRSQKRQIKAKCIIDYTDPIIDQSIEVTANEQARISFLSQTADGVTTVPYTWACLDGTWVLGQPWRLAPDSADRHQLGWWGTQLADIDGFFSAPYPALTLTHAHRPIHTLTVVGDSARKEYPVDFTIDLYDINNSLLYTETVFDNNSIEWSAMLESPVLEVTKQVLTIIRWSHPGRQAKIIEFFTSIQQVYEGDNLISIRVLEEREVSQGSLPVGNISANEITIRLPNEDKRFDPDNDTSPLYGLIKPNRRIRAWLGVDLDEGTEWVPLGIFWASGWETNDMALEATVRALDRMDSLKQTTYRTSIPQQNMAAAALARDVLEDAGLAETEFMISDELENVIIPWAWMGEVSHREALRVLAEACMAVVYCDREGRIRIELPTEAFLEESGVWFLQGSQFPAEASALMGLYGIGPDDYFSLKSPSSREQVANEITVITQPVAPGELVEVFRSNAPIIIGANQTVTVTVQYNKKPAIDAMATLEEPPAGVNIVEVNSYSWGADIEIENKGAVEASVTLVAIGTPLEAQDGDQVVEWDEKSAREDGVLGYEFPSNHLIQTVEQAQGIAQAILASSKVWRRDIEFDWRGNPAIELGDVAQIVTDAANDRRSTYAIIWQELEWAGYLSARSKGRRLF